MQQTFCITGACSTCASIIPGYHSYVWLFSRSTQRRNAQNSTNERSALRCSAVVHIRQSVVQRVRYTCAACNDNKCCDCVALVRRGRASLLPACGGQLFTRSLQQFDRIRKRNAFVDNYRKEPMFADNLDEFEDSR